MSKEEQQKIIDAAKAGKIIEYTYINYEKLGAQWVVWDGGFGNFDFETYIYRISDIIPYSSKEEFAEDSKRHGPYIKVNYIKSFCLPSEIFDDHIVLSNGDILPFNLLIGDYDAEWADGTKCCKNN